MKSIRKIIFVTSLLLLAFIVKAQIQIDDFENGLDNWEFLYTVYPDYYGFEYIPHENQHVDLTTNEYHSLSHSMLLYPTDGYGAVRAIYTEEQYEYGKYTGWFFLSPNSGYSTDAHFYFQHQQHNKFYIVKLYPDDSDVAGIKLNVNLNGEVTVIADHQPNETGIVFNQWYKIIVERYSTGQIKIKIYDPQSDTENLLIDVYDETIHKQGYVGVGCFSNSVYWDDIGFDSFTNINLPQKDKKLGILTNPINESLVLKNNGCNKFDYKIYNMQGQLLKQKTNCSSKVINVSDLLKGLYIIKIYCNSQSYHFKFVK